jgi:[acyl-carrier-protein] S-malonyltransferase
MMARQIASKVRWYETITGMIAAGVDTFIEIGPKTVLMGMMKKIVPKDYAYKALQVDSPDTLTKCIAKLSE